MAGAKRGLKIVGWVVAVLVLLAVLGGGALWFGGAPLIAWLIEHPVSTALGRQITIGKLALRWLFSGPNRFRRFGLGTPVSGGAGNSRPCHPIPPS